MDLTAIWGELQEGLVVVGGGGVYNSGNRPSSVTTMPDPTLAGNVYKLQRLSVQERPDLMKSQASAGQQDSECIFKDIFTRVDVDPAGYIANRQRGDSTASAQKYESVFNTMTLCR